MSCQALKFFNIRHSPKIPKGYYAEMCHFSRKLLGYICSILFYTPQSLSNFLGGYPWKWLGSDKTSWKWGGPFLGGDPLIFGVGIPSLADQIVDENFDQLNVMTPDDLGEGWVEFKRWSRWHFGGFGIGVNTLFSSKVHVACFCFRSWTGLGWRWS